MADEKKPISADSPADDAEMSCRDVVMGAPADEGRATDHSDHRRKTVQLAIAGVSLVLVLGSAGYFALNPDAMSMGSGAAAAQAGSNADGGTPDAELDGGASSPPTPLRSRTRPKIRETDRPAPRVTTVRRASPVHPTLPDPTPRDPRPAAPAGAPVPRLAAPTQIPAALRTDRPHQSPIPMAVPRNRAGEARPTNRRAVGKSPRLRP